MQYEAKIPGEYLEQLEPDWRKDKLEQIRKIIKSSGPELVENIEYKMLCYGNENQNIFHLNAQRTYVSLYVGNIEKVKNSKELLKEFDIGKGCIRVKKNIDLTETKLEEFIKRTINTWREGGNTYC